jgi:LmbE family N-acetylglucosaminyl deacetylase
MNILAIGAHPDDIEAGCAGTLAKYARAGHGIFMLVMTEGGMGGATTKRRGEQTSAAAVIGVREIIWGGYEDTQLTPSINRMIQTIEKCILRIKPDFIFVHHGDDTHQDHRSLSHAAISATRYVKNVLFYEGPTTQNFYPTVFVDIIDTFDVKLEMLLAHASQVEKTNIEGVTIADMMRSTAVFRGIQGRVQLAEGFMPVRVFIKI